MPRSDASSWPHTPDFEIHEQRDERSAVRLSLSGELDLAVAEQLRARLQALARAHTTVTLDLSDLQFIDSTGLHVLITHLNLAAQDGWTLQVEPKLTRQVRQVIELVGIDHILWPRASNPGRRPVSNNRQRPPTNQRSGPRRWRTQTSLAALEQACWQPDSR